MAHSIPSFTVTLSERNEMLELLDNPNIEIIGSEWIPSKPDLVEGIDNDSKIKFTYTISETKASVDVNNAYLTTASQTEASIATPNTKITTVSMNEDSTIVGTAGDSSFNTPVDLKRPRVVCDICQKTFTTRSSRNRHFKRFHFLKQETDGPTGEALSTESSPTSRPAVHSKEDASFEVTYSAISSTESEDSPIDVTTIDSPTDTPTDTMSCRLQDFLRASFSRGTFILVNVGGSQMDTARRLSSSGFLQRLFDYETDEPLRRKPSYITVSQSITDLSFIFTASNFYCHRCNQGFRNDPEKGPACKQLIAHFQTPAHSSDSRVNFREVTHFYCGPSSHLF